MKAFVDPKLKEIVHGWADALLKERVDWFNAFAEERLNNQSGESEVDPRRYIEGRLKSTQKEEEQHRELTDRIANDPPIQRYVFGLILIEEMIMLRRLWRRYLVRYIGRKSKSLTAVERELISEAMRQYRLCQVAVLGGLVTLRQWRKKRLDFYDAFGEAAIAVLRLAAKYVRFSYIADKTNELSYFRATGGPGSGKSRFIGTVGMLCLRPILVANMSAAALYRMLDAYSPTLIVDECNFEAGSEDSSTLMQVLNCGFQRLTLIPRMERAADGRMTLRMFSAYGPKLIGSLKVSDSPAFESRCVAVALQKTARRDIPFRMTERMMRETAELRAKLTLWRLRNWHRDYEEILDRAEADLKGYSIEPRFIQIAIPLYGMLAEDQALKASFARMLEGRTEDAASERQESFDGRIVAIVHELLFEVQEGEEEGSQPAVTFRTEDGIPEPEDGQPCELVLIDTLTERINEGLPEKRHHDSA